ncbi:MAG: lantibiotic dehydratase [Candidatus Sulfotelmatobacter sp.]
MADSADRAARQPRLSYEATGLVMVRVPLLDEATYRWAFSDPLTTTKRLWEFINDPIFAEMLAVASPVVAARIDTFQSNAEAFSPKRAADLLASVARYLIRATTRPTPFGLFAGVGVGSLGDTTALILDSPRAHKKVARLDYQVVLRLVQDLERDPKLRPHLDLFSNPALYRRGERVLLAYRDSYGQGEPGDQISVRASRPLLNVLSRSQTPERYCRLLSSLRELYPATSEERLDSFLQSLLEQRILLSTLRPPLSEPDPLQYLQHTLSAEYHGQMRAHIDSLRSALDQYNRTPLGQGAKTLRSLTDRVQNIFDVAPACVQVDTRLALKAAVLPFGLAEEVSRAVLALLRISPPSGTSKVLGQYAREFVERYGQKREISLLELLDNEVGLGSPPTYINPSPRRPWPDVRVTDPVKRKEWLSSLLGDALQRGSQEIQLDDAAVDDFPLDHSDVPPSVDVFITLAASGPEAIDRGQYLAILGHRGVVFPAGRAMGRFAHLDPALGKRLENMAERDSTQNPDVILADLIYAHPRGHANNVSIHLATYRHQVAVATTPGVPFARHIPLSDLVVGVNGEQFYLWSRTLRKQLVIRASDLLSPMQAPNAVRFIWDVSAGSCRQDIFWAWGDLAYMPFLPRVRFSHVVLCPARWRLPQQLRTLEGNDWADAYDEWRKTFGLPRYAYSVDFDNRLLLDLDHPLHQKIIRQQVRRGRVMVEEPLPSLDDAPVTDLEGKRYMLEAVISLFLANTTTVSPIATRARLPEDDPGRIKLPGEDCLYLKLYGPRSMQDDLLIAVEPILTGLGSMVTKWFFVRYADPDTHLRIRLFGEPGFLWSRALSTLNQEFRPLYTRGLLSRVAYDTYDREIERYGGSKGMAASEDAFSIDSSAVISLIKLHRDVASNFERENLILLGLDVLLRGLGFNFHARRAIYKTMSDDHTSRDTLVLKKKRLSDLVVSKRKTILNHLSPEWILSQPYGDALVAWAGAFQQSLAGPSGDLWSLDRRGQLLSPILDMGTSLGHMHCNRGGLDPRREHELAYVLWRVSEGLTRHVPSGVQL